LFQSSNVKSTPVRVDAEVELDKDVLQRRGKRDDWRCLGLGNIAEGTGDESVDRLKDEVIDRVQETITRAHRNPQYRSALRTMLEIIRKYATKLSLAASSVPRDSPIRIKPPRQTCYTFIGRPQILLECCASGTSLDPLLSAFRSFIIHISMASHDLNMKTGIQEFFSDLRK